MRYMDKWKWIDAVYRSVFAMFGEDIALKVIADRYGWTIQEAYIATEQTYKSMFPQEN